MTSRLRRIFYQLDGIWKSVHWRAGERLTHWGALLNRRRLTNVEFVAITGTAGKTSTKDLCAAILATLGGCQKNPRSANEYQDIDRTILATRRKHRFCLVEASAHRPGSLDRSIKVIRPTIAAVTLIGREHYSAYKSAAAVAEEKGKLVAALPPHGTAVLNIDDPQCRMIAERHSGRIIWVGSQEAATVRLLSATSRWPEPLRLKISYEGKTVDVRTQLHGTHLSLAVLTAIGIALAAGASVEQAVAGLESVLPPEGRMEVVASADGVVFIRDDWKAPQWSLQAPLDFVRDASAKRKVVVIGTISDSSKSPSQRYAHAARDALKVADLVVLIGTQTLQTEKLLKTENKSSVRVFASVREAAVFLGSELSAGDLVLLKGTNRQDHLVRLILHRQREVLCWQTGCGKTAFCGRCSQLYAPSHAATSSASSQAAPAFHHPASQEAAPSEKIMQPIIVGLGNSAENLKNTLHNVGYRTVDNIARANNALWEQTPEGSVAHVEIEGIAVTLFKPGANINRSGPQLDRYLARTEQSLRDCVIVYDDMDLEIGTCREKRVGGDGGHKGLKSIIATFGTDEFRRVRVGVRRPGDTRRAKELVLTQLTPVDDAVLAKGLELAEGATLTMVRKMTDIGEVGPEHISSTATA